MTARPDVPDTPDREPASIIGELIDDAALMETGRSIGTIGSYRVAQALLATDDPVAVAAIADQWAEHHPDTLLDALTKAGVLQGEMQLDPFGSARAIRREVTRWREVTE